MGADPRLNWSLHGAGASVALAIVAAALVVSLLPISSQLSAVEHKLVAAQALTARHNEIHQALTSAQEKLASEEARMRELRTRIPTQTGESEFLAELAQLARECDLHIHSYEMGAQVEEGPHTALEVQLDASVSYRGLCRFLGSLHALKRFCRVSQLQIRGDRSAELLPTEMTLRIYFAPPHQPRAKSPTAMAPNPRPA